MFSFVHSTLPGFSIIGVLFDVAVCYLGKDLDLYGTLENDRRREFIKEDNCENVTGVNKRKVVNGNANQRIERTHL